MSTFREPTNVHLVDISLVPDKQGYHSMVMEQFQPRQKLYSLVCTCSRFKRKKWCIHVRAAMGSRFDVMPGTGFSRSEITGVYDPKVIENRQPWILPSDGFIKVPLFHDPHDVNVLAILNEPLPPTNFREVSFAMEDDRECRVPAVGLVPEGAARWDIRMLIIEWLLGQVETNRYNRKCIAPQHSFGSPYEVPNLHIAESGMPDNALLIDHLMLYTEGRCYKCKEDDGIPDF